MSERIEAAVVGYLRGLNGVSTLASTRVYQLKFRESTAYPAARVVLRDEPAQYTHDGVEGLRWAEIQVDAADAEATGANASTGATALADAIDAGLSGYVGPMGGDSPAEWSVRSCQRTMRSPAYDDPDEARVVRIIQVYTLWYRPST